MCCCYKHIQTQDIFEIAQVLNLDAPTIIYLYHLFLAMFWSGSVAEADCGCPEKYIDIDRSGAKWDRKVGCSCACAWTLVVLDGKVCWACDPSMFTVNQSKNVFSCRFFRDFHVACASWSCFCFSKLDGGDGTANHVGILPWMRLENEFKIDLDWQKANFECSSF